MRSPLGPITLLVSERGARAVSFGDVPGPDGARKARTETAQLEVELREYFAGRRREFSVPLDAHGTRFQEKVWRALCTVPYGKTATYADIARKVGSPRAFRAVGGANRCNPLAIVVPCHRIIGADGSMTGYGGPSGIPLKVRLLALESASQA